MKEKVARTMTAITRGIVTTELSMMKMDTVVDNLTRRFGEQRWETGE